MALNKVVLAGGTGFLGKVLCRYFRQSAKEIIVFSRSVHPSHDNVRYVEWDGQNIGGWTEALEDSDLLINLCGKNVNCRYTEKNKREIFSSRLEPTSVLAEAMAGIKQPPLTWINLASATIYRHAQDRPQDEESCEIGSGFSVDVCRQWENLFFKTPTPRTKKMVLRVGLALGPHDGVFPRLKNLVRLGMGGHQGPGSQMMSWIHQHDFARVVEWVHVHGRDGEVYNATSPEALSNREFMKTLRKLYGMPFGLPTPQWLLELGAGIIGTETELILKSRWVYPKRLLDSGFTFHFPALEGALADILSRRL